MSVIENEQPKGEELLIEDGESSEFGNTLDLLGSIDDNTDKIIDKKELDKALSEGFFNDENGTLTAIGELLNNAELSEVETLISSLKETLEDEIDAILNRGIAREGDIKMVDARKGLLGEENEKVQELEGLINLQKQQEEEIKTKLNKLSKTDKDALKNILNISNIDEIDKFLDEGNVNLLSKNAINHKTEDTNKIKAVNILNNVIKGNPERHKKLEKIVKDQTLEMSHSVNIEIAKNAGKNKDGEVVGNIDYYNEPSTQKMLIQLRANVCYGEDLIIDGYRGSALFSLDKEENKKLTTLYIYRLEILTRRDVIEYRHNKKDLSTTDNLLNVGELDNMLSVLPREEQNKVMEDFLNGCFFHVRVNGMHFEDLIGNECFRRLLDLTIKERTEKNISIEQGIADRENLLKILGENGDENIIKNIQEEIEILKTQNPITGEYIYKTMGDYYKSQVDDLNKAIKEQNKDNVNMEQLQHASEETRKIMEEIDELFQELNKPVWEKLRDKIENFGDKFINTIDILGSESKEGDESKIQQIKGVINEEKVQKFKVIFTNIIEKIATLYNNKNTTKYKEWIEDGSLIDLDILNNLAVKFNKFFNEEEKNRLGQDFKKFMDNRCNDVPRTINRNSDILDITNEIYMLENTNTEYVSYYDSTIASFDTIDYVQDATFYYQNQLSKYQPQFFEQSVDVKAKNPNQFELHVCHGEYSLSYGPFSITGGLRLKELFEQMKSGKINVILINHGKLCKYEENEGDILLYEFDKDGNLPENPTKTITSTEIVKANMSMTSALESIDTKDFNDVMSEFDEDDTLSFAAISDAIQGLVDKYNDKNLSNGDVGELKSYVQTMLTKIDGIDTEKLFKLKNVLNKMRGNGRGYTNQYEQAIQSRIDQIDTLIKIQNDNDLKGKLEGLLHVESNDEFRERVNAEDVIKIICAVAIIAFAFTATGGTAIFAAPAATTALTGSTTIGTFLLSNITYGTVFAIGANVTKYVLIQGIRTSRNFVESKPQVIMDKFGNRVEIPGKLSEKDKTSLFKCLNGEIGVGELLLKTSEDLSEEVLLGAIEGILAGALGDMLKKAYAGAGLAYKTYRKYESWSGVLKDILALGICSKILIDKRAKKEVNDVDVIKDIGGYVDALIPDNIKTQRKIKDDDLDKIFNEITVKEIEENGNMTLEYDPDDPTMKLYLAHFEKNSIENPDGSITINNKGKILTMIPSKVPSSFRRLLPQEKEHLEKIGGVNVDQKTGKITYKNPEGLENLRALGAYLENSGQGNVYISEGNVKITFRQASGQDTVITVKPQKA